MLCQNRYEHQSRKERGNEIYKKYIKKGIIAEKIPIFLKSLGYFCIHFGDGIVTNLYKINSRIIIGSISIIRKDVKTNVLPVIVIKLYSGKVLSE